MTTQAVRKPPTPKEIWEQQKADYGTANVPAVAKTTAVAAPDNRSAHEKYLDSVAPISFVGRLVKFGKEGFVTQDDDEKIRDEIDHIAMCDQTLVGVVKFNGEGQPPTKVMGLLYGGFEMPDRESLGDLDRSQWEIGLDGKPSDPWQHQIYLVLQRVDNSELFTYVTSSITGRRAIGNLLRHYDRMQKTHAGYYPLVRLKVGGFQHRDDRVGWVNTPNLAVIGRVPGTDAVKPGPADMNDDIPF
jgi:hypothetical protein